MSRDAPFSSFFVFFPSFLFFPLCSTFTGILLAPVSSPLSLSTSQPHKNHKQRAFVNERECVLCVVCCVDVLCVCESLSLFPLSSPPFVSLFFSFPFFFSFVQTAPPSSIRTCDCRPIGCHAVVQPKQKVSAQVLTRAAPANDPACAASGTSHSQGLQTSMLLVAKTCSQSCTFVHVLQTVSRTTQQVPLSLRTMLLACSSQTPRFHLNQLVRACAHVCDCA